MMMVAIAIIQRRCGFPKVGREFPTVAIIIEVAWDMVMMMMMMMMMMPVQT